MFAICCEESARHFVQTVGFNAEMLVPWAKGFFQDTKLPLKLLKLWHLPCSGNSESYLQLKTVSINKQNSPWMKFREFRVFTKCFEPLTRSNMEWVIGWRDGGRGWVEGCYDRKGGVVINIFFFFFSFCWGVFFLLNQEFHDTFFFLAESLCVVSNLSSQDQALRNWLCYRLDTHSRSVLGKWTED